MQFIRIITLPILPFYAFIVAFRNWSYDKGIINSNSFDIPIISVGNLSVGGTGKTPSTEYLIRLLKVDHKLGVLSRGYRRKTKDYLEVEVDMTSTMTGDEPLQMKRKFPEIIMSVDRERLNGITSMLIDHPEIDAILLDDAYQHRAVRPGINILLTTFDEPFFDDKLLPIGDLREFKSGKKRADIVMVTKCPDDLSQDQKNKFKEQLNLGAHQLLCFSKIGYGEMKQLVDSDFTPSKKVLLVTGIAKPEPLKLHLETQGYTLKHVEFRDHHSFSRTDIANLKDIFDNFEASCIITTEKDATRLKSFESQIRELKLPICFLEIQTEIVDGKAAFDEKIISYVKENKDNHRIPEEQD